MAELAGRTAGLTVCRWRSAPRLGRRRRLGVHSWRAPAESVTPGPRGSGGGPRRHCGTRRRTDRRGTGGWADNGTPDGRCAAGTRGLGGDVSPDSGQSPVRYTVRCSRGADRRRGRRRGDRRTTVRSPGGGSRPSWELRTWRHLSLFRPGWASRLPKTSSGPVVTWGTPPRCEGCRSASQGLALTLMTVLSRK